MVRLWCVGMALFAINHPPQRVLRGAEVRRAGRRRRRRFRARGAAWPRLGDYFTGGLAAIGCARGAAGAHVTVVLCGTYDGMLGCPDVGVPLGKNQKCKTEYTGILGSLLII